MSWLYIIAAGLLEVGWAIGLKYTDGFRRPLPSLLTGLAIAASLYLLSLGARTLPIGTAYAVWVGIGTFGTGLLGVALFGEPVSPSRLFFLALLLLSVLGLKATSA